MCFTGSAKSISGKIVTVQFLRLNYYVNVELKLINIENIELYIYI